MPSQPTVVFERLCSQVDDLRAAADLEDEQGRTAVAEAMWRASIVLSIAALDSFMHELGVPLLVARAAEGTPEAETVARYLRSDDVNEVCGPNAAGAVRWRLSYKTLVAPKAIDALLEAGGLDAAVVWRGIALAAGSQPNRLRSLTEVQYDRRNQIAHEGDWDSVAFDFRRVSAPHVADCLDHVKLLVGHMEQQV